MKYTSVFSYYGSKSKVAHLYPAPRFDLIVEPFGGSGAYAWRHHRGHEVWINDLDPITYSIWMFLQSDDALGWINQIPDDIQQGNKASELIPDCPNGLLELLRAEANGGTQGSRGVHDQITKFGTAVWHRIKPKLRQAIPVVRDWQITNLPYSRMVNVEATWFVDSPYANPAGNRYRTGFTDHATLGTWCRTRRGQIIACENDGADWLPFRYLSDRQGVHSRYQLSRTAEVVWTNEEPKGSSMQPSVANGVPAAHSPDAVLA